MSKYKCYLSSSKQANLDDLRYVRTLVKSYGIEVLEHTGGAYDPTLVDKADFVIIVPYRGTSDNTDLGFRLGKGNGSEGIRAKENNSTLVILDVDNESAKVFFEIEDVIDIEEYNTTNWKTEYYTVNSFEEIDMDAYLNTYKVAENSNKKNPLKRIIKSSLIVLLMLTAMASYGQLTDKEILDGLKATEPAPYVIKPINKEKLKKQIALLPKKENRITTGYSYNCGCCDYYGYRRQQHYIAPRIEISYYRSY